MTISQLEDDRIVVSIIDPMTMVSFFADNPALEEVAVEAAAKLSRVAAVLQEN